MINNHDYSEEEYCMSFSNNELRHYLISKLENLPEVKIRILSNDKEIPVNSNLPFEIILFNGYNEDFYVSFLGVQTSIFVKNQEIMFIDENYKCDYTESDVYHNVVYEGCLRRRSHEQILELICQFIVCFINAEQINIIDQEFDGEQEYEYYERKKYVITVQNQRDEKHTFSIDNIVIFY